MFRETFSPKADACTSEHRSASKLDRRVLRLTSVVVLAAAITGMAAFAAHAQGALPAPESAGGIEYVSGGFGSGESQAFKQAQSSYPLALTFAEGAGQGSNPYVADVRVVIKRDGNTIMDVPSVGPYFLARLEPGKYTIEATYRGQTQTHDVTINGDGSAQKVLSWPMQ